MDTRVSPSHGKWESESCGAAAIPQTNRQLQKTHIFLDLGGLTDVHKLQRQKSRAEMIKHAGPAPQRFESGGRKFGFLPRAPLESWACLSCKTTTLTFFLPNLETTENLKVCSWLGNNWGFFPVASGAAKCSLCPPKGRAQFRQAPDPPRGPRTGPRAEPGPASAGYRDPRSSRPVTQASAASARSDALAARPPQEGPVSPRPSSRSQW